MKIIGVTGQAGSGKSLILDYIEEHYKCRVLRADKMAASLQEPGGECYQSMRSILPGDAFLPDGRLDRAVTAALVFDDMELLGKINAVIHPAVKNSLRRIIRDEMSEGKIQLLFFESAILIEAGFKDIMDEIWYVYADEAVRIKRLIDTRGYDEKKIAAIRNNQRDDTSFRENCDIILDNSGRFEDTAKRIKEMLDRYSI